MNRGLSGAQRAIAYNYEEGDVIRFTRGSKQFAIAKGDYARVEAIDRDANLLTVNVRGRAAGRIQSGPALRSRGLPRRTKSPRTRRPDPVPAPDRALGVANGEFATIKSLDAQRAVMQLDNGQEITAALDRLRHIDHGYASTSHSAQGATVDRVIVDIDTRLSPELVNRKQFYVSISRARTSITIYTDDRDQLPRALNRSREKSVALEHPIGVRHSAFTVLPDEQRQTLNRGHGLRR